MVPCAMRLFTACVVLIISQETLCFVVPANACRLRIYRGLLGSSFLPKSSSKFIATTAKPSKLYGSELLQQVAAAFTVVGFVYVMATVFVILNDDSVKKFARDSATVFNILASKIKTSEVSTVSFDLIKASVLFVERPALLKQITDITDRKDCSGEYYITYGAKGVDKSTIVDRAVKGKKGILMLKATTAFSRNDLMQELRKVIKTARLNLETNDFIA